MRSKLLTHIFAQLVEEIGGGEAAQAAISATVGHSVSSATISKMRNGTAEPSAIFIAALEEATGLYPFTDMLERRRKRRMGGGDGGGGEVASLEVLREFSEALVAVGEADVDGTPENIVKAYSELAEAVDIGKRKMAALGARIRGDEAAQPTPIGRRAAS